MRTSSPVPLRLTINLQKASYLDAYMHEGKGNMEAFLNEVFRKVKMRTHN